MNEKLIKLMNKVLMVDLKSDYVVYVTVMSGIGIDVHIFRKSGNGADIQHEPTKAFWRVNEHPELLQAALDAVEAVIDGTYTGGAPNDSATAV